MMVMILNAGDTQASLNSPVRAGGANLRRHASKKQAHLGLTYSKSSLLMPAAWTMPVCLDVRRCLCTELH